MVKCVCVSRNKIKTVELVLCIVNCSDKGKKKIFKYKLQTKYNFGDSAYKSYALIFAFKRDVARYKDEWQNSC